LTLVPWAVWLLPLGGALFIPAVERIRESWCRWYAVALAAATTALSAALALTFATPYVETLGGWSVYGGVQAEVYVDGLSVLLGLFVSSLSLVILVYASGNMRREGSQGRFYFLMMMFIGAMMGLVMAGNLIQFYLLWEVLGICSALLIAFWREREPARRAGVKAFLVTRIGDVALLLAVILIFAGLHTADISAVVKAAATSAGGVDWTLVGALVLVGAMGKSAQVPLHVWLPDAMEGPTPVSALIHAATMVNAGVYLLVRLSPIYASSQMLTDSVLAVGLASVFVGGACACAATDIKRVLAYSTISQIGLMFAAVGVGSASGAIYLLMGAGIFKALAFMSAGSVSEATGTRDLLSMGGLAGRMKITYAGFLLSSFAMAGFPPFFGFWTKEYVEASALGAGPWIFGSLLVGSALTSFYMFRVLFRAFHGEPKFPEAEESGGLMTWPMALLGAASVAGWLALSYQPLYSPPLSTALSAVTSLSSVAVVTAFLAAAYLAFGGPRLSAGLMVEGGVLQRASKVLTEGIWFDAAYSALVSRAFRPLARSASRLQSGDMGMNTILLLVALFATIVVAVLVA
jgi:NADH-quinone oxidoreductase subunit L